MRVIEGNPAGMGLNVAIICSRWNDAINERLIKNCHVKLCESGVRDEDITLFRVPGCLEIPRTAQRLSAKNTYSVIICLGSLINNSLTFQFKAQELTRELLNLSVSGSVPIVNAVVMTENEENGIYIADAQGLNYGAMAATSALEIVAVENKI